MDKQTADGKAPAHHITDEHLGAVEGDRSADQQPGNANATALDDQGLPEDKVAIAEDSIGARNDESQG